ncbi:hypothetical protein HDU76_008532 [Blyttiomyces sp. JEL0837]|nr:hypothetical protein HDU76_008532 [Blyttiomyces sp. JEL0837]
MHLWARATPRLTTAEITTIVSRCPNLRICEVTLAGPLEVTPFINFVLDLPGIRRDWAKNAVATNEPEVPSDGPTEAWGDSGSSSTLKGYFGFRSPKKKKKDFWDTLRPEKKTLYLHLWLSERDFETASSAGVLEIIENFERDGPTRVKFYSDAGY